MLRLDARLDTVGVILDFNSNFIQSLSTQDTTKKKAKHSQTGAGRKDSREAGSDAESFSKQTDDCSTTGF